MSLTTEDKLIFEKFIEETSHVPEQAEVLFKVFHNIAMRFNALPTDFASEVTCLMQNGKSKEAYDLITKSLQEVVVTILSIVEEETFQSYTTGQLAKLFGVSVSTINNWIDAKRFVGFSREKRNKQARISETTVWISPTGESMTIGEVARLYEGNQKRLQADGEDTPLNRMRYVVDMIDFFENRYEKTFDEVIAEKGDPSMSDDMIWSREGKEWRAFLREIGSV